MHGDYLADLAQAAVHRRPLTCLCHQPNTVTVNSMRVAGVPDPDQSPLLRYRCIVPKCPEVGWARSGSVIPTCPKHEVEMKLKPGPKKKR